MGWRSGAWATGAWAGTAWATQAATVALLADDVESASEVSSPAVGQVHALTATSVQSASEVSSPSVGQVHALTADDVESASEVSTPAATSGTNNLLAEDVESASEVSSPSLGQVHALLANDLESASQVSVPRLNGADEVEQPSGGWLFLNAYDAEQQRRRAKKREREELEEQLERIEDGVDREIALLLQAQEAKDEKRRELERLSSLAKANADIQAARQYSARVAKAFERAIERGNFSALEALDRELQRAAEEEEFLLIALMLLD